MQVCREMGLRSDVLPPLTDIEAGQGVGAVAACLWELAEQCRAQAVPVRTRQGPFKSGALQLSCQFVMFCGPTASQRSGPRRCPPVNSCTCLVLPVTPLPPAWTMNALHRAVRCAKHPSVPCHRRALVA